MRRRELAVTAIHSPHHPAQPDNRHVIGDWLMHYPKHGVELKLRQ